ncbi:hypothetical protein FSP39_023407 [Pinctada imbricata]|uniref:SWIM-type domain-containing protein n=1 Tax=Pinctada imbricata TaxID=66713 RepID=A0AA88Y125_PINIB|nr:hypothetical protein FSP39_023407 [Pinctada imbricata]
MNVDSMQKPQLKAFLSERGLTVSDYSVHQLRELSKKAIELNLPIIKTPDDTEEMRKTRSRVIIDGECIKFFHVSSTDLKEWTDDLKNVPVFSQADIFVYLLSKSEWSPVRLQSYKSERGYRLFQSNHIHTVLCHQLQHDHLYIKAKCIRETSQSADPYRTWCLLNSDGSCVSAGCECTGDDGGCKHVVALLFSLAQWSERHTDRNTETCTDRKCVWDVPRKVSMPKLLDEIELSSNRSRVLPLESMYDPTVKQSNSEIEKMVFNLVADTDAQILEVLDTDETNVNDTILQTNVPETLKDFMVNFKQGELLSVFGYLSSCTSEIYCTEINKLTVDQSESSEWYKYRHGRITSSIMHNACHYKGSDPDNYVVKQIMNTEQSSLSTPAVLYGKEREPLARSIYEKMYMNEHKSSRVALSGLIINASYPHLGASPDGVVQCKCCGLGILEIKCPYKFKNHTFDQICKEKYYIQKDENGCLKLKENSNWYTQIQTQMAVSNAMWCDFVLYLEGDVKNGKHKIYTERIYFDKLLWNCLHEKSKTFFEKFVVPKLKN